MKSLKICDWLISFSFSCLFFLTPLILTPWNYELFEYNKMMLVYALTIIITGTWLIKMIIRKKILFQRTPFDLALLLFLLSQIVSTFFSMDPHVSLFGYYSRFNGGLFSVFSYLLLYYALVSNINNGEVLRFLKLSLLSALVVSFYGILEHFGIDKNLWVQNVQNRVFSTLGQPNWLGAYLAIMIPIGIGFLINSKFEYRNSKSPQMRDPAEAGQSLNSKRLKHSDFGHSNLFRASDFGFRIFFYYFLLSTFYLCLLYTKSRSGLMGFGVAYLIFWLSIFWIINLTKQATIVGRFVKKLFVICNLILIIATAVVGTPWTPSLQSLVQPPTSRLQLPAPGPALETGGTESGEIRKIVWSGAIDIARHYPLFGTGPETFAFSYYKFRPVAHNLVSEWDFLYNKAHNEYLNYAATTGFVGLGTYLLFIGWFLVWNIKHLGWGWDKSYGSGYEGELKGKRIKSSTTQPTTLPTTHNSLLVLALFAAWLSILITNFFGFSVVIISLYFWLIPAFCVIILRSLANPLRELTGLTPREKLSLWQKTTVVFILFFIFYFLFFILKFWYADVRFNAGYQLSHAGYYQQAYEPFHEAITANPGEPFYHDELSYTDAMLAVTASQQKEATLSSQLAQEALSQNKAALSISPLNVNFQKTQTKVYYTLSSLDPNSTIFDEKALASLQIAQTLALTDPKITYNIALLYGRLGKSQEAIKTLEETITLKSNYQDARYALALFYHEAGKKAEARSQLEYILKNISPTDKQIQEKLKEWGK